MTGNRLDLNSRFGQLLQLARVLQFHLRKLLNLFSEVGNVGYWNLRLG